MVRGDGRGMGEVEVGEGMAGPGGNGEGGWDGGRGVGVEKGVAGPAGNGERGWEWEGGMLFSDAVGAHGYVFLILVHDCEFSILFFLTAKEFSSGFFFFFFRFSLKHTKL